MARGPVIASDAAMAIVSPGAASFPASTMS